MLGLKISESFYLNINISTAIYRNNLAILVTKIN
jgi:hypothetical protein